MSNLYQFNPGRKSWKIYANKITSISGDDLILSPYDGENLILEVSGNNEIIFKKGDTSYNLEDLINLSLTNYSDASFNNVEVSGNFIVRSNVGINTEIPSEKLDVNGNIKVNNSILGTNDKLELYTNTNSSDSYGFIELRSSKCTFGGPNLEFYVNSTNTSFGNRIIYAESNGVAINKGANAPTHTLEVNGDIKGDNLFLGDNNTTPKIDMYFNESQTNPGIDQWRTKIEIGKSNDFTSSPAYPPLNSMGMNIQNNSDRLFVGIETYDNGNNYRPLLKWGDDSSDTPFTINSHSGNHKWEFHTDGRLVVPNSITSNSSNNLYINSASNKDINFTVNNDNKMIIKSDGKVGIGTTTPSKKLDVNGDCKLGQGIINQHFGSGHFVLSHTNNVSNTGFGLFLHSGTGKTVLNSPGSYVALSVANKYILQVFNDHIQVGTRDFGYLNNVAVSVDSRDVGGSDAVGYCTEHDGNWILIFYNSARTGSKGKIRGTGASNSVVYDTNSDRRLKENITQMPSMLEKIKQLKPVYFTWKQDGKKGDGFIAQEVHKVLPQLRDYNCWDKCKCGMTFNDAWDGKTCMCKDCDVENPKNTFGNDYIFGLDYGKFTPYMVKAMQEQQEIIEKQETLIQSSVSRIEVLENVNSTLKNEFNVLKNALNQLLTANNMSNI